MGVLIMLIAIPVYVFIRWKLDPGFFKNQGTHTVNDRDYTPPGRMSPWARNSVDSRLIAHLYLASVMIRIHRRESREKMQFVHRYIARYFKGAGIKAGEYMSEALRYDVDVPSVTGWARKRMTADEKRSLMEFLISLSLEDGVINQLESNMLSSIGFAMGLDKKDVEARILHRREAREQAQRPATPVPNKQHQKSAALRALGLTGPVTFIEVKRKYRMLVKQYHPDGWTASSGLTRSEAEEQFLAVQKAYEYLENNVD